MRAGLVLRGARFDVLNSVFDGNGQDAIGPVSFGGVYLGTVVAAGQGQSQGTSPARFAYNTLVANRSVGLVCESATQPVAALLSTGNTTSDVVNCAVSLSRTTSDGDPRFDIARPYHLTLQSPCLDVVDVLTAAAGPATDLDNNPRPSPGGGRGDCGAHELQR
jgi:hypothetical protein